MAGLNGAIAAQLDEILRCGEHDVLARTRVSFEHRFGKLEDQESPSVLVGVEVSRGCDSVVRLSQGKFTSNSRPLLTSPGHWAARR